jgi:hypothetical protein
MCSHLPKPGPLSDSDLIWQGISGRHGFDQVYPEAAFIPEKGFNWYVFTGVETRLVLQNIFLDGNTFKDSHSVDKKPLVGDVHAGIVLQYDRLRFSYTHIFRSKEFDDQVKSHKYGSLSISYQF